MRAEDGEIEEKRIALTLMMHCCYERNQKKTMRQNKAGREKGFGFRAWRKETDDDNQKPLTPNTKYQKDTDRYRFTCSTM